MKSLRSPAEPRVLPEPLGSVRDPAGQLYNRSVRIIQAAVAGPVPLSARIGGGGQIRRSPRIGLGIPIASRQEGRHEATIRTPFHEAGILEILITTN